MSNLSDYTENRIIDLLLRGQTFTPPVTLFVALYTAAPSDAGGGTEVSTSGTGYARASVTASLANFSGTQATASTTASTGTGGRSSNNSAITFGTPTAAWGSVTAFGVFDASTGGNLLFYAPLAAAKTVNAGDPAPTFPVDSLSLTMA